MQFNDIRDRLQAQFPEMNDRALGFAVRMLIPLVVIPSEHRWAYLANSPFGLADEWIGPCRPAGRGAAGIDSPLSRGVWTGHRHRRADLVRHLRTEIHIRGAASRTVGAEG